MTGTAADGTLRVPRKLDTRAARMVSMLALLQSGERLNAQSLAEAFGVHRRTIFRDLAELRDLGISIGFSESKDGYLVVGERSPAAKLSLEELGALLLAAKLSPLHEVTGVSTLLASANSKLLAQFPKLAREEIGNRQAFCERHAVATLALSTADINLILDAIQQRHTLHVRLGQDANATETELEPWRMRHSQGTFWLMGQSLYHQSAIALDLRSCISVSPGERTFSIPRRLPKNVLRIDRGSASSLSR